MNSHFCTTDGVRTHYLARGGDGEAEPLFLMHGLSSNAHVFDAVIEAGLAPGRALVAVDLRGRGLSDQPATGYSMEAHARDLLGVLDARGVARATLVGHSFGGRLAYYLGAKYPARVRRIVALDAAAEFHPRTGELLVPALARLGQTFDSFEAYLEVVRATPQFYEFAFDRAATEHYRADVETLEGGRVRPRPTRAVISEAGALSAAEPWYEHLAAIAAPTLLLNCTGAYGLPGAPALLPRELAEKTVRALRRGTLGDVPGNHMTMMFGGHAPAVARAINAFVKG